MYLHYKIFAIGLSLLTSFMGSSCNLASGGFAGLGGKKQKAAGAGDRASMNVDVSQSKENQPWVEIDIDSPEVLADIAATSTEEYLAQALANASNEVFGIGGFIFSDVKDTLLLHEAELMALANKYPTLGDFIDSRGGDRYAPIEIDNVAKGLSLAEGFVASGNLDEVSIPSDNEQTDANSAATDQATGFSLQQLDKEAAREAKLFALTVAAIGVTSQTGLHLGNYANPSEAVRTSCGVVFAMNNLVDMYNPSTDPVPLKYSEECMCQHYPHGCKMAEEAGKPLYCTGAPTPNDIGYDPGCPK